MLVLQRKCTEKINIWLDGSIVITLTVNEIRGDKVRIGINAPTEYTILRAELEDRDAKFLSPVRSQKGVDHENRSK